MSKMRRKINEFNSKWFLSEQGDVLEEKSCANFLDYQLAVTSYQVMSEETIIEVFGRINSSGKRLSNQERRKEAK